MVKFYRKHYSLCYKCMRITTLLIGIQACFATMLLAGTTNAQNINLDVQQAGIKQVFLSIEKQANVTFVYNEKTIQGLQPLKLKAVNKPLSEVLINISQQIPLQFKQSGSVIGVSRLLDKVIQKSQESNNGSNINPPRKVSGIVTDDHGSFLPGVTVREIPLGIAVSTDKDGKFVIPVYSQNATLVFSYIGFETKEIAIGDQSFLSVSLVPSKSKLDEVQVIAYGTTTQRLSTGAIGKVGSADIDKQTVSNPLEALEGRIPGMVVTQNSGIPGSAVNITIRGRSSIENTSQPLYLIDGVPFNANSLDEINGSYGLGPGYGITGQSPFNSISPQDIESVEVLKDADATAIYGSRGANGVILITTKKGIVGKTQVNGNFAAGAGVVTRSMDYLNTAQYLAMRREAFKNDGATPDASSAPDLTVWDNTRYTDWKKLLIGGTAQVLNADANITGGNDQTQFLVGTNYHRETTVFPGNYGDDRANVHFNLTHNSSNKRFYLMLSAIYSNDKNNLLSNDLTSYINTVPNAPAPYNSNGQLNWSEGGVYYNNPLGYTQQPYSAVTDNLVSNAVLKYTVIPGLDIKTNLGYTNTNLQQKVLLPQSSLNPSTNPVSSAMFGNNTSKTWIIEPQLEYKLKVQKNTFTTLLGSSWQQDLINGNKINATNFSSDLLINSPAAAGSVTATTNYNQYRYESVFGRITYNYDNEYILNVTGRRDGSTRFGPNRQFANFGSAGLAWIFTEEEWFKKNVSFLSFGKIRGSYGITGNDKIGDYNYLDTYVSTSSPYQGTSGLRPSSLSNPNYAWEINTKLEAALDLGFLRDRILISADYFRNRSSNELVQYTLPNQTGFSSVLENFPAVVQNSGFEISINSVNVKSNKFSWSSSFNISIEKNKLVSFPGISTSSYANTYVVGYPLNVKKLLVSEGVDPQTGIYQFNGTNIPADQVSLQNVDPKFYGGLNNSISYKGFQLDFFFQFVKQNALNYYGGANSAINSPGTMSNQPTIVLNRWQNPGDHTAIQKFSQQAISDGTAGLAYYYYIYYSDGIVSDASFIRLKNASLSYSLPSLLAQKIKAQKVRVYVQGQNLLTITKYKGNDPESGSVSGDYLPPLRVLTAGIQFTY